MSFIILTFISKQSFSVLITTEKHTTKITSNFVSTQTTDFFFSQNRYTFSFFIYFVFTKFFVFPWLYFFLASFQGYLQYPCILFGFNSAKTFSKFNLYFIILIFFTLFLLCLGLCSVNNVTGTLPFIFLPSPLLIDLFFRLSHNTGYVCLTPRVVLQKKGNIKKELIHPRRKRNIVRDFFLFFFSCSKYRKTCFSNCPTPDMHIWIWKVFGKISVMCKEGRYSRIEEKNTMKICIIFF